MLNFPRGPIPQALSLHYSHPDCISLLDRSIYGFFRQLNPHFDREVVYLCIGTDRATGDCLGPLVGTLLQGRLPGVNLFGNLEYPSHAINLFDVLEKIALLFTDPLIVAIDASLGCENRIGYISVQEGGLAPGTALQKSLPTVGDFHISAVVNVGGYLEQMMLQNTRLFIVYRMAELIAQALCRAHFRHDGDKSRRLPKASFRPAAAH
ncbi:MAG: spore protease YyaC [Syntrophomonadaceae bacterium]